MEYVRQQHSQVLSRLSEPRGMIQVIVGPRQVGKTTLMSQVLRRVVMPYGSFSADDVPNASALWLSQLWESQRMVMSARGQRRRLLVVDEVQKVQNWSEVVKAEWDRDTREGRELIVVLLGSSRLLIEHGLTESLAGRYEIIRLTHWTLPEMRDCFGWTLPQYVYYGGFPGAARFIGDEERWRAYVRDALVEPAISRDVLMDTRVLKPQLLRQLFELGSSYSGELLSLTKVAGQLQDAGNVTTLSGYLRLLDEAGLLCGLQKYACDEARRYQSIPKFQVHNSALRNVYAPESFAEAVESPQAWGRCVESAVGAYLVSQASAVGFRVYYWREKSDEVDYVLLRRQRVVALEVKSGRRTSNSGLPRFAHLYHPYRSLVVGSGGMAFEEFFTMNLSKLFT